MRRLTIKRRKTFVGCLAKMKIYIEDAFANDLVINNIHCRKLGELKNNEEKSFEIDENQAKVFVIADKLSKNFCNEFYQLSYGQEDIFLTGKNKFNVINGNAFRFDNNQNEEALQNRKTSTKKGILIFIISIIVGFIIGNIIGFMLFKDQQEDPRVFSDNGMSITLTNEFIESQAEKYTNYYYSDNVDVLVLKEDFALLDDIKDYTLEEYADFLIEINSSLSEIEISSSELKKVDGLTWFEYEYTSSDTSNKYQILSFVYKSTDAFWVVEFGTPEEIEDEYRSKITEWAKTVSFE